MKIKMPKLHINQQTVFDSCARFLVLVCGRRFGKSTLACYMALKKLFGHKDTWWVFPTEKMGKEIGWMFLSKVARQLPSILRVSETDRTVWYGQNFISVKGADKPERLVGVKLDFLIIDEAGTVKENVWNESLRPTLIDLKGECLLVGTPKGHNWFNSEFEKGKNPDHPDIESFHFTTYDNPFIDFEEIEREKRSMPKDKFDQEYLAKVLSNVDMVFKTYLNNIINIEPQKTPRNYIGIDLARKSDYTTIVVLNQNREVVHAEKINKTTWNFIIQKIKKVCYNYRTVPLVDSTGVGDAVCEQIENEGVSINRFMFNNKSKNKLIEKLVLAIEDLRLTYNAKHKDIISELESFEKKISSTGTVTYNARNGAHDDYVIALALANLEYLNNN